MLSIGRIRVAVILFAFCMPCVVGAAIVQFNTRASWQTAVPGGGNLAEDFNAFAFDVVFRPGRILTGPGVGAAGAGASQVRHFFTGLNYAAFSMGTLTAMGYDWNYNNFIDTPPIADPSSPLNTAHVPAFINAPEANRQATTVRIDFTDPMNAWGADFYGARTGERLAIDVLGAGDVLLGTLLVSSTDPTFLGFVGTAGEQVHALILRSQLTLVGAQGEAFLMEDAIGYSP
jgi:hypothetical protein